MKQDDTLLMPWSALADGTFVEAEGYVDGNRESLILHRDGGEVCAWLNVCPHAGRRLDWAPGQFLVSKAGQLVCAAHGAAFEIPSGECVTGPCRGQSLVAVTVVVDDEGVRLPGSEGP